MNKTHSLPNAHASAPYFLSCFLQILSCITQDKKTRQKIWCPKQSNIIQVIRAATQSTARPKLSVITGTMLNCPWSDAQPTWTNSTLKIRSDPRSIPKLFKELFEAKAVTRVLQTLVDVFKPPATPTTTPKHREKHHLKTVLVEDKPTPTHSQGQALRVPVKTFFF